MCWIAANNEDYLMLGFVGQLWVGDLNFQSGPDRMGILTRFEGGGGSGPSQINWPYGPVVDVAMALVTDRSGNCAIR